MAGTAARQRVSQHDPASLGDALRSRARSFAFAARFLDRDRRRATEVLYAFFRTVDDLVDEPRGHVDADHAHRELDRWRAILADPAAAAASADPLVRALTETMLRYQIPAAYPCALLRGLADDLDARPIQTFDDLERYAFRVAGSVGLVMCHVLGATGPRALLSATALGIGMQLTNILRDVAEDRARGRCYLPADELARYPGADQSLARGRTALPLELLLAFQVSRARRYYAAGAVGLPDLPPEARFPIALALRLYGGILDRLERQHLDVFAGRAIVGRPGKIVIAAGLARDLLLRRPLHPPGLDPLAVLGRAARSELVAVNAPVFAPAVAVGDPAPALGRASRFTA